jgi:hypothetical protein
MKTLLLVALTCVLLVVLIGAPLEAATYRVAKDGTGQYTTVQACAAVAQPGDTCEVAAGVYAEKVLTVRGGTSEAARIRFVAQGVATIKGFTVKHGFITIEGFDITGYTVKYGALVDVIAGGNDLVFVGNTIRDTAMMYGLRFHRTTARAVVRDNKFSGLNYVWLNTNGTGHLFESNSFRRQLGDLVRLFGVGHVFRRNVFMTAGNAAGMGHPDVIQTFGSESSPETRDILFEENFIANLNSQLSQMNAGDGVVYKGILYPGIRDITFRRNVIANVSANANISFPGATFENNTFYRMAYNLGGVGFGGSLNRGQAQRGTLRGNVFLAGGANPAIVNGTSGWYAMSGENMGPEALCVFVTKAFVGGVCNGKDAVTQGIWLDLRANLYLTSNGGILPAARALTDISQFKQAAAYAAYRQATFDTLRRCTQMDTETRATFLADYNYVAGSAPLFSPKKTRGCIPGATYTPQNFCEPHGVNGGDPKLRSLTDLLGPDGIPFTVDDGLKPLPGSPLCGKGPGGSDIGAYSCDPNLVFPGGATGPVR